MPDVGRWRLMRLWIGRAEAERDAARYEAAMVWLETDGVSSARAQMESELA